MQNVPLDEIKEGESNSFGRFFVQDWNYIRWRTATTMACDQNRMEQELFLKPSPKQLEEIEKENVYHLALTTLETSGLIKQEIHDRLVNSGNDYERVVSLILGDLKLRNIGITFEKKELLEAMLDRDVAKRPSLNQILERIKRSEE